MIDSIKNVQACAKTDIGLNRVNNEDSSLVIDHTTEICDSEKFTQLQALQKATKLLDQLVAKGKLDQGWETDLQNAAISKRKNSGKDEVVVSFQRQSGDPKAVYIFFNSDGKYSGSNFTGE